MNTKSLLIAALATVFAGAALAEGKTFAELQQEAQLHAPSTTTRAAVLAELLQARAAGTLNVNPDRGPRVAAPSGASALTRAEVQAQLAAAQANGTLNVSPGNDRSDYALALRVRNPSRGAGAEAVAGGERM